MQLHYKGKYNADDMDFLKRTHPSNAVEFKPLNSKKAGIIIKIIFYLPAVFLFIYLLTIFSVRIKQLTGETRSLNIILPCVISPFAVILHEFLHAICFKKDVYLYSNLSRLKLVAVGTEDMSKTRFIIMKLLPEFVLGVIPFVISLLVPQWVGLGFLGAFCIAIGTEDYIIVANAIIQVPNDAMIYMSEMRYYWYKNDIY